MEKRQIKRYNFVSTSVKDAPFRDSMIVCHLWDREERKWVRQGAYLRDYGPIPNKESHQIDKLFTGLNPFDADAHATALAKADAIVDSLIPEELR